MTSEEELDEWGRTREMSKPELAALVRQTLPGWEEVEVRIPELLGDDDTLDDSVPIAIYDDYLTPVVGLDAPRFR